MAYLLTRFPLGTLAFTVAVIVYSAALHLIAAPIVAPFDSIELGIWEPDSLLEGLVLLPLGLVLLVAACWISEGMAAVSRSLVRWGAL
jgi:Putative sensor